MQRVSGDLQHGRAMARPEKGGDMENRGYFALNRAVTGAQNEWIHLLPVGEHPGVIDEPGKPPQRIIQVVDATSLNRVMAKYEEDSAGTNWGGYLVDRDHFSHYVDQSSEATGWIKILQRRADGIWGQVEWTDLGTKLIDGNRYKHLSPANGLAPISRNRYRIISLSDVGLTNKPTLKTLVPIRNRDRSMEEGRMELLDTLRTALSAPDATEDQVLEKVRTALNRAAETETLQVRVTAAETERDELKAAALNRDADAFVRKYKSHFPDEKKLREAFTLNREVAEAMVSGLDPVDDDGEKPVVLNRETASQPKTSPAAAGITTQDKERREFVADLQTRNRMTATAASSLAASLRPDLFSSAG